MFDIGDWVVYLNQSSNLYRSVGFITSYAITDDSYYVCLTRDAHGRSINKTIYCREGSLAHIKRERMAGEAYRALIDIALATKDYEWCKQLTEQYNRTKV